MADNTSEKKIIVNYPSNSHKEKETPQREKRVERVVTSDAVTRKRPLGTRIKETFTGDDMHSVGTFILFDVALPALKAMLSDVASQGVERMLFGDSRPRSSSPGRGSYTSYNRMYTPAVSHGRRDEPRTLSQRARSTHDFGEVILASRGEAEEVLDRLGDLVKDYDVATVADLYDMVGITGSYTDDKWGWTDLRGSEVRRVRDGYLLVLPRTAPIE